jgi:hypothetical protein
MWSVGGSLLQFLVASGGSEQTDRVYSGAVAVAGGSLGVSGSGAGGGLQEVLSSDVAFAGFSSFFYQL